MERILCAANWYKDLEVKRQEAPISYRLPKNINHGVVFCGHRHLQCLHQMVSIYGLRQCEAGEEVQGFLTSENRFVSRKVAAKIAYKAGQLKEGVKLEKLFSEDLY